MKRILLVTVAALAVTAVSAQGRTTRERVARPNLQMNPTQLKSVVNGSQAAKAPHRTKQSGLFYTRPQGTLWRSWGKDGYGYGSSVIMAPGMVDQTYLNQSSGSTVWTMVNSSGEDVTEAAGVAANVDANNNYVTNIFPKGLYYTPVINTSNLSESWSLADNNYYYKTGETDRLTYILNDSLAEMAPFDDHGWTESDGEIYGGRYGWGSLSTDNLYGSGYLTDSETGAPYAVCEGVQIVLGKLAAPLYVEDVHVGGLSLSGTPIAEGDTLKLEITNVAYLRNGNPCAGDHVFETLYAVSYDTLDFQSTSTRNGKTVYSGKVVFSKKTYDDIGWEIVEPFVLNPDSMYALRLTGFATEDHEMNENIDFGPFGYEVAEEDMPHHLGRNYPDSAITSFSFFPCYYWDEDATYYHYYSGLAADFHLTAMFDACEVQADDSLNVMKLSDDGTEMTPIYASEENQDINCILANTTTYVFDPYDEETQYYSLMIDTITGDGDWITGVHFAEQWREDEGVNGGHEQIYFQAEALPAGVEGRYAILYLQSNRTGVRSQNPIILLQGNVTLDEVIAAGISTVKADKTFSGKQYNLAGQQVKNARGIVVADGRKFVK